jgi:hypothetical protein
VSHTPGPWTLEDITDEWDTRPRYRVDVGEEASFTLNGDDARLIAAAPDLLAALENAHGILQYNLGDADPHVRSACDVMWAAIAKATRVET